MADCREQNCWICGSGNSRPMYHGTSKKLSPADFNITDSNYGSSLPIRRCEDCSFAFCPDASDILSFYEEMSDEAYVEGHGVRRKQAAAIFDQIKSQTADDATKKRLLDVGAGSGIFLEEAMARGFDAVGVEPSRFLCNQAASNGLDVRCGVLSDFQFEDLFEVVLLIDVIEHVEDPMALLEQCQRALKKGGVLVIVTPDFDSLARKILGKNWWHIRFAHIGYFNIKSIRKSLDLRALKILKIYRPVWYFEVGYLKERITHYLPFFKYIRLPKKVEQINVPLNLRDSLSILCVKQ